MADHAKQYDTLQDIAKKWRVSEERLKNACELGDVDGAAMLNGEWIIPSETKRPRIKSLPKPPKSMAKYVDSQGEIIARAPVQEAVIEAIEKGDNLAGVTKYKIGNTTFIVTGTFKRQGRTLEETLFGMMMRDAQDEGLVPKFPDAETRKKIEADFDNIRSKSPVFTMTKEQKMDSYRKMLANYGFTENEVERLMIKIEADYEEPNFDTRSAYKSGK